jgi:hypothetical protein
MNSEVRNIWEIGQHGQWNISLRVCRVFVRRGLEPLDPACVCSVWVRPRVGTLVQLMRRSVAIDDAD